MNCIFNHKTTLIIGFQHFLSSSLEIKLLKFKTENLVFQ